MRVCVYKNLNRGCWSIAEATATGNRGKVLDHVPTCALSNAVFVVKESRRRHVVAKHCREVHAWIVGDLLEVAPAGTRVEVTYNPYRAASFTLRDGTPVHAAPCVVFNDRAWLVG
jgi:hypothetical protein